MGLSRRYFELVYERLLGGPPSLQAHETEVVWELAEHASVFIHEGIEPDRRETYSNGVRKAIYRDADGNEISFGRRAEAEADHVRVGFGGVLEAERRRKIVAWTASAATVARPKAAPLVSVGRASASTKQKLAKP